MSTSPQTLAKTQHDALKDHVVQILERVTLLIKAENYSEVEALTAFSPAGDGMGCDNCFINFSYEDNEPLDIIEVVTKLINLKIDNRGTDGEKA